MGYTLSLGEKAPNFSLLATDGETYSLENFSESKGLVIFFTCNHCPYVIGSNENTRELAEKFQKNGISFVGINSNSPNTYEADSYDHMKSEMQHKNYPWTYLYDANQSVARAYGALKTPHFYLFNENRELIYTGRAVDYPRDASLSKTHELHDALESFISKKMIQQPLTNPIGCNIKWDGKPPHWMPPHACDIV
jgi:peroxiredoxin